MVRDESHILLVDDHPLVIEGIRNLLSQEEGLVFIKDASDGLSAIHFVNEHADDIDIVITDINMPQMGGISLCRKIKSDYPRIKVLMLSMYDNVAIVKECIAAEADGYILKNSSKQEFINAIRRVREDGTYYSQSLTPIVSPMIKEKALTKPVMLSAREKEVLQLIVKDMTSGEIADRLFISKKTVDNHRASLLEKTGSRSTIGLVIFAFESGVAWENQH